MSRGGKPSPDPWIQRQPARVLIAGSNLLAGTLARTLGTHGFVTAHTAAKGQEIAQKLEWRPDLALIDLRHFNVQSGSVIVRRVHKSGCPVCVIDRAGDGDRASAWFRAGSSAVVGEDEPFDQLFQTITRLLRVSPPRSTSPASVPSKAEPPEARRRGSRLELFERLTEREQVVLSELIEGQCAEDIAKAAFVSISTVRSQIRAILQKLGVNSQLAAVAMARRAGWFRELPTQSPQKSSNPRSNQAS
jgi:two-component system, NarL family, nitrate/nitrite response regulator NarL